MSDVLPFVFSFPEDGKKTPEYNGACIYLICSPDGTPYVGQAKKFRKRMRCHKSNGKLAWIHHGKYQAGESKKKVCAISFAINKHGWENMQITILQKYSVWDQQLLDSREQYLIRFYDSFKNGYNSNEGGNRCKPHPCSEETKAKISAGLMGIGAKAVTSCEIKESYSDGTQLVNFVQYPSAMEAQKKTGVYFVNISECCNKKTKKSAGGRYWFFTKQNHPPQIIKVGTIRVPRIGDIPMPGNEQRKRKFFSESPSGEKQLHESLSAAERTMSTEKKKFNKNGIFRCCSSKHKQTHYHKYKFWFASDEEIADFEKQQKEAASNKRKRK